MAALTMTVTLDLRLVALLARLCHELSGPIGAVGNGVELLGEDDPDFVRDAVTLIRDNARRAANGCDFIVSVMVSAVTPRPPDRRRAS
jgi:histidine phosphotransferase ChpT